MQEEIEVVEYKKSDLDIELSTIVFCSFYYVKKTMLTHQPSSQLNTDKAGKKLYEMTIAMLQLSNADLTRWKLMSENEIENMLIKKASQNITIENISSEQQLKNIEAIIKEVLKRLEVVEDVYDKTRTISSDEEYETACKQWDELYDDEIIPQYSKK